MSSFATLPSLDVLQTAFAPSLEALSSEAADSALEGIRQIPAFEGVSGLKDLVSPHNLAHMAQQPTLFTEISRILGPFGELPGLKEAFSRPELEDRILACAPALDLKHGVRLYVEAVADHPNRASEPFVRGALIAVWRSMSRVLRDELSWPQRVDLESLGPFAVSIRKAFQVRGESLTSEQRSHLMRLAAHLDAVSPEICRFEEAENLSSVQAHKIGTLIEVLYGCGFGEERCLDAPDRLHRLVRGWGKADALGVEAAFRLAAETARDLLGEAEATNGAAALIRHLEALKAV
jgi:hypothetical protein